MAEADIDEELVPRMRLDQRRQVLRLRLLAAGDPRRTAFLLLAGLLIGEGHKSKRKRLAHEIGEYRLLQIGAGVSPRKAIARQLAERRGIVVDRLRRQKIVAERPQRLGNLEGEGAVAGAVVGLVEDDDARPARRGGDRRHRLLYRGTTQLRLAFGRQGR